MFNMQAGQIEQRPELNWRAPGSTGSRPTTSRSSRSAGTTRSPSASGSPRRGPAVPAADRGRVGIRLPGRDAHPLVFGDDPARLDPFAWTLQERRHRPTRSAPKRPNAFGLFDMHGNAWEWCSDGFGPYAGRRGRRPQGPPRGRARVLRGGSFDWENVSSGPARPPGSAIRRICPTTTTDSASARRSALPGASTATGGPAAWASNATSRSPSASSARRTTP